MFWRGVSYLERRIYCNADKSSCAQSNVRQGEYTVDIMPYACRRGETSGVSDDPEIEECITALRVRRPPDGSPLRHRTILGLNPQATMREVIRMAETLR